MNNIQIKQNPFEKYQLSAEFLQRMEQKDVEKKARRTKLEPSPIYAEPVLIKSQSSTGRTDISVLAPSRSTSSVTECVSSEETQGKKIDKFVDNILSSLNRKLEEDKEIEECKECDKEEDKKRTIIRREGGKKVILNAVLYQYQKQGLAFLKRNESAKYNPDGPFGTLLFDAMGLGKTVQVISLVLAHPKSLLTEKEKSEFSLPKSKKSFLKATLIVCPVSTLDQWKKEFEKFTNPEDIKTGSYSLCHSFFSIYKPLFFKGLYYGNNRSLKDVESCDVILTTYGVISSEFIDPEDPKTQRKGKKALVNDFYWWRIVIDEAHTIKNPKARVSKAICQLQARNKFASLFVFPFSIKT